MKARAVSLALALLASCATDETVSATGHRRIILTSFQPLYSFAAKVVEGSPSLEVVNLAPRSLGPHDFDLDDPAHQDRCRDLARRAQAVVTLRSLAVAPNFDRLYPWCRRENIRIVEIDPTVTWDAAVPKLPLLPNPEDTARAKEAGGSEARSAPNPHVWLSLTHAVRLVEAIERDVAALDPDRRALYRSNADRFQAELRRVKADYERKLASVDRLSVATLTEGFPYLTSDFGIEVVDYLLEPKGPAEITGRVRKAGMKVVLAEEPPAEDVAKAITAAGARVVVLTTIEEGWPLDPARGKDEGGGLAPDGYLRAMKANLDRLVAALGR